MNINGKVILYTGAAGGLGLPTTLRLMSHGATVVAVDNDPGKIARLQDEAAGIDRGRLVVLHTDMSDLGRFRADIERTSGTVGGYDVVINNAAIYPSRPFEDYSVEEYQAVQRVNVEAGFVAVQVALPTMRAKAWGRIINVSSITFYGGWALLAPYVASKGALVGLTRAWAREFGPSGITANAISPGAFPTDAETIHPDPEGYSRFVLDHQAVKRRGDPADIANAVAFLASDESGFITGQVLNVDGGWVMH